MARSTHPPDDDVIAEDDDDLTIDDDEPEPEPEPEFTCNSCGCTDDDVSQCDNNEGYCTYCCGCYFCEAPGCGAHFSSNWKHVGTHGCDGCYHCDDCGCVCEDDDYVSPEDTSMFSDTPPWVMRGFDIMHDDIQLAEVPTGWDGIGPDPVTRAAIAEWGIDDTIDICQSMADFYLLDGIAHLIFNGVSSDTACQVIASIAADMHAELVNRLDDAFIAYVDMAVGGELRHHPSCASKGRLNGGRSHAWREWRVLREQIGPDLLVDAAALFREYVGAKEGGIGGERWAQAADLLHARITGKIDARTWVDRVFTMQHNGGSLLNKIAWPAHNRGGWMVHDVKGVMGPAHAADPPAFGVLLYAASGKVCQLFADYWRAANSARRALGMDVVEMPTSRFQRIPKVAAGGAIPYWKINGDYVHASCMDPHDWRCDPGAMPVPELTLQQWAVVKMIWFCGHPTDGWQDNPPHYFDTKRLQGYFLLPDDPVHHHQFVGGMLGSTYTFYFAGALKRLVEEHDFEVPDTSDFDLAAAYYLSPCVTSIARKKLREMRDTYLAQYHGSTSKPASPALTVTGGQPYGLTADAWYKKSSTLISSAQAAYEAYAKTAIWDITITPEPDLNIDSLPEEDQ